MKKKLLNQSGQSLVEVVIALAVAVLVLLALVSVTISSINNASFSRNQSLATKYAKQAMEDIRAYRGETDSWAIFAAECISGAIPLPPPPSSTFSMVSLVCSCSPTPDPNTCDIVIEVDWTDAKGTHQSKLQTVLTDWQ